MWANTIKNTSNTRAFTIVELLIVIVVIAILAAISIVAFNGVQDRARSSAAASSSTQAAKKVKIWQVDNEAMSPTCAQFYSLVTGNSGSSCSFDYNDTNYQYSAGTSGAYCVTTTVGNKSYKVSDSSSPQAGGCSGHGQAGVAAITNLVSNPRATTYSPNGFGWRNTRWAGSSPAAGNYTLISGASDGPVGITTYARKTWTTAPAAIANSGDTGFDNTSSPQPVNPGETYNISCYLRPSVNRNFNIAVYQYTSAGATSTTARDYKPPVAGPANQWTRVSATYTVPTTGVGRIQITCDSGADSSNGGQNWAAGSTLDGTGMMVTRGSELYSYADGFTTNWTWNGTQNNSTSTGPPN